MRLVKFVVRRGTLRLWRFVARAARRRSIRADSFTRAPGEVSRQVRWKAALARRASVREPTAMGRFALVLTFVMALRWRSWDGGVPRARAHRWHGGRAGRALHPPPSPRALCASVCAGQRSEIWGHAFGSFHLWTWGGLLHQPRGDRRPARRRRSPPLLGLGVTAALRSAADLLDINAPGRRTAIASDFPAARSRIASGRFVVADWRRRDAVCSTARWAFLAAAAFRGALVEPAFLRFGMLGLSALL